jgi:hypothetical protein
LEASIINRTSIRKAKNMAFCKKRNETAQNRELNNKFFKDLSSKYVNKKNSESKAHRVCGTSGLISIAL